MATCFASHPGHAWLAARTFCLATHGQLSTLPRFIRAVQETGRLVYAHPKVYCLLRAPIRISKGTLLHALEQANPPHILVKSYAQKSSIGTSRGEYDYIDAICRKYPGCSLRVDIACYVYPGINRSITLVRALRRGAFTNPLLPGARNQSLQYQQRNPHLPEAYGWCFGGRDSLGIVAQTTDGAEADAVSRWKAYAPFKHVWHQATSGQSMAGSVPRVRGHAWLDAQHTSIKL